LADSPRIVGVETIYADDFPHLCYVRLHTDSGLIGLGETFFGPEAVSAHVHSVAAPYLLGKQALHVERHWQALYHSHAVRSIGAEGRALSAIDVALWDLFGQVTGLPIYQLLGGPVRDRIRVYNTVAGYRHTATSARPGRPNNGNWGIGGPIEGPYEDYEAQFERPEELAQSLLAQGITAIKLFPFAPGEGDGRYLTPEDLERGVAPFRRIRQALGNRVDLLLDMGGSWSLPAAMRIARALEEYEPFWYEDPVRYDGLDAWAEFRQSTRVPTAGSENLGSRYAFHELLAKRAADIVLFDPGWVGGISEGRRVAALTEAYHRPFCPHDCTGPVAMVAGIHLCISSPNAMMQETVRAYYTGAYRDIVTTIPRIEGGYAYPPEGPGLGTALQPDFLRRADAHVRVSRLASE
jgi:L-alanine-DL-glutamate epimerase-like enolase superfamily enzyme